MWYHILVLHLLDIHGEEFLPGQRQPNNKLGRQ